MNVPAWAFRMIERIVASEYASVELVVLDGSKSVPPLKRVRRRWRTIPGRVAHCLLERSYAYLVRKQVARPDAMAPCDATPLLEGVPVMRVRPIRKRFSDFFEDSDVDAIEECEIDVFVRLGFRILRGRILSSARHGVWSYYHGDNRVNRGGPAGFWEVAEDWPTTGSILQVLNEDLNGGLVLQRSWSCTSNYSVECNRNNLYWKMLSFVPRKLEELHRLGPEAFFEKARRQNAHPDIYDRRLYTQPTNAQLFGFICRIVCAKVANLRRHFMIEQWALRFHFGNGLSTSFRRFKRIDPPLDRFWADPFVLYRDGKYYVYFEELIYTEDRGRIMLLVLDEEGDYSPPVPVLERPYHLSYPFLLEHGGELYMIPETAQNRTIETYRCTRFPDVWEPHATLMDDVCAVDATLFEHVGRWWLFANIVENEGASSWDELFLFHAESPLSTEWTPHPCNPIVSDVSSARPAGELFRRNGRIYRPSQDSSRRYGYGMKLHEITDLSPERYAETCVEQIEPKWGKELLGTHTLNHRGRLTVIDVLQRRRRRGASHAVRSMQPRK